MKSRAVLVLIPVLLAVVAGGCRSARDWRKRADRRAEAYLSAAQRGATGETEPIAIETPADTLRRRLLLDQGLPTHDPASFGIRDLPANRYWDPATRLEPGAEPADAAFAPGDGPLLLELEGRRCLALPCAPGLAARAGLRLHRIGGRDYLLFRY